MVSQMQIDKRLPSITFIQSYFDSYFYQPNIEDPQLLKIVDLIKNKEYKNAFDELSKINESTQEYIRLNLLGTFHFLYYDLDKAYDYLKESMKLKSNVNSLLKMGNITIERGDLDTGMTQLNEAIKSAKDPLEKADSYYHRGQMYLLSNQFTEAIHDFDDAISYNKEHMFAKIQKATCMYRQDKKEALKLMILTKKEFDDKNPGAIDLYLGELFLDQMNLQQATKCFDYAIEKTGSPLAFINKAMILAQNDLIGCMELFEQAKKADPDCDMIYIQYGQVLTQAGRFDQALDEFDYAIQLARTPGELTQSIGAKLQALGTIQAAAIQEQTKMP
eukprot:NODE_714_length_4512_cov_0.872876.p1 type:complete len:332 gc:universal NODE_714_length_4512_cov_0.872876:1157-2152(+)